MTSALISFEHLESRRLLAIIGPDFAYGSRGAAPYTSWMQPIGLQSGQKLIGLRHADENARTILDRRLTDGQIDPTFTFPKLGESELYASTAAIDTRDRIIAVTTTRGEWNFVNDRPLVQRFNADGTTDESFGQVRLPVPGKYDGVDVERFWPRGMAVDSQDRILILHHAAYYPNGTEQPGVQRFYLDRLLPDGRLDPAFGSGGRVLLVTRPENTIGVIQIRINSHDKPVIAFGAFNTSAFLLALTESGTPNAAFGGTGTVLIQSVGSTYNLGFDLDADDRAVVFTASDQTLTGVRYLTDGTVDPSFAASLTSTFLSGRIYDTRVTPGGKIVGTSGQGIFRVNADGTPDPTFDDDGIARLGRDLGGAIIVGDDEIYVLYTVGSSFGIARIIEEPAAYLDPIKRLLHITGTAEADTISVRAMGDETRVAVNDQQFAFATDAVAELRVHTYAGNDQVSINLDRHAAVDLGAGDDSFTSILGRFRVAAGDGNDTLVLAGGDDLVQAGGGDDAVDAGAGNDTLLSTGGDDSLVGDAGDDLIRCSTGINTLIGGEGRDTIRGGAGDDSIDGQGGRDRLFGNDGNDTITGGGNNDRLAGGSGADRLIGGGDDDLLVDRDPLSLDTIIGGAGVDRAFVDEDDDVSEIETILDTLS